MSLFRPQFDLAPYTFRGEQLREVAFPLGGIGTGCVSLDGRGALRDWEIFGRPNKGSLLDFTFAALYVRPEGGEGRAMALHGPRRKDFVGEGAGFWSYGQGQFFRQVDGIPAFDDVEFHGTFPVARVRFSAEDLPVRVELAAVNPFIPSATRDSSFPLLCLTYRVENVSDVPVEATIAWTMMNPVGEGAKEPDQDRTTNRLRTEGDVTAIEFRNERFGEDDPGFGDAVLATAWPETTVATRWRPEGWWDSLRTFWNTFRANGRLQPMGDDEPGWRMPGSLGAVIRLAPGEVVEVPFVIAWRFPNAHRYWGGTEEARALRWQPFYAGEWPSAFAATAEFFARRDELNERTLAFEDALYRSSLDPAVLMSVGATASILHSPTVMRLGDGTFWAWEGCSPQDGCCEGSCSHVWNYALTHAYLMPEMQRNLLDAAFGNAFNCGDPGAEGAMLFRIPLPIGATAELWHAASDGQLGQIIQAYRDWRLHGDEGWIARSWPSIQKAMRYAFFQWDRDQDGLVDGDMHNTYDINFQTANPLSQLFYMGALRACEELARHFGDSEMADRYAKLYRSGRQLTEQRLWNGEYLIQEGQFGSPDDTRYQHGAGCLSDQVFGQLCASLAGLGDLIDPEMVRSSLRAIYRHNFRAPLGRHTNLQRVYCFPDEPGLLLCTWPNGEEPYYPFVYSDEVWTGIEYQVATHLAMEGMEAEALDIVRAIRSRYDGTRRNPFNEFECGSHYARALASYGLIVAMTGMRYDALEGRLEFRSEPFRALFAVPGAWGVAERRDDGTIDVEIREGALPPGTKIH